MKKAIYFLIIISLIFTTILPASAAIAAKNSQANLQIANTEEENNTQEPIDPDDMLHMLMTVKWGHVVGEVSTTTETIFDGSISIENATTTSKLSLIRTLLFEKHNDQRDKVNSRVNPIEWQSLIYNHWDGIRVLVSTKASENITISTDQGSVTKTAQELYELNEPLIVDVGDGKEVWIKTHAYHHRKFIITALWGSTNIKCILQTDDNSQVEASLLGDRLKKVKEKVEEKVEQIKDKAEELKQKLEEIIVDIKDNCTYPEVNFSGYAELSGGSSGNWLKSVRFEERQGDKITNQTPTRVDWNSYIQGGFDGLIASLLFDQQVDSTNDTLNFNFTSPEVNWSKTYNLFDLYHNQITKEKITIDDIDYYLILAVKRFHNRHLIKTQNKSSVYIVEDGTIRPILTADVFEANGLKWDEIEIISQEELNSYAQGDPVNYPDGTIVKGSGPGIWIIAEGLKRKILDLKALSNLGFRYGVRHIPDSVLAEYKDGVPLSHQSAHPEGSLLRLKGTSGVYLVKGGKLKAITDKAIFESHNFQWNQVLDADAKMFNKYKISTQELNYPDGTLIKGSGAQVYLINQGKKQHIKSATDFTQNKFSWNKIKTIKDRLLNKFEVGNEVVGE